MKLPDVSPDIEAFIMSEVVRPSFVMYVALTLSSRRPQWNWILFAVGSLRDFKSSVIVKKSFTFVLSMYMATIC
jgi:hypothetical protein